MLRISGRGMHGSHRRTSGFHRAFCAALLVTLMLFGNASAAMDQMSGNDADSTGTAAVSADAASQDYTSSVLNISDRGDSPEESDKDTTSEGRVPKKAAVSERAARLLRTLALSRAVREELSERSTVAYANQAVTVFGPGRQFPGATRYENGVTFADAEAFARFAGAGEVSWVGGTLRATGSGYDVSIPTGEEYVVSSGRLFWTGHVITQEEDGVFVPIDALARAFGLEAEKEDGEYSVHLTGDGNVTCADAFYREDEVYWLSRIIQAESGTEPLRGKIAVGNVILNRVRDERFPDTIYGVIFDRSCGIQFSPTANGTIYCEPSEESVAAAKICLEGYSISDEITFFFNPAISKSTWISDNRPWVCTIGNHAFYS